MKYIEQIKLTDEIVCSEKLFSVGRCGELSMYIMNVVIPYICWYDSWYAITKEDYLLMKSGNTDDFINKHALEINFNDKKVYGSTFLGSQNYKRDYLISVQPDSAHGYIWLYNALFMNVEYGGKSYAVAPGRKVYDSSGNFIKYEFDDREKYPELTTLTDLNKNGVEFKVLCGMAL